MVLACAAKVTKASRGGESGGFSRGGGQQPAASSNDPWATPAQTGGQQQPAGWGAPAAAPAGNGGWNDQPPF